MIRLLILIGLSLSAEMALAQGGFPAVTVQTTGPGEETWSLSLQALALMTALTMLPAFMLMMTSFTRIIIVLAILRTALGTAQTPSNQILLGLALFLTLFVMQPVFDRVYGEAIKPYLSDEIGFTDAIAKGSIPFREFMLKQTREDDVALFVNLSGTDKLTSPDDVSMTVLLPAFVTSELKTAFQIGFLLFLPFLIIDLVVASVLMSMGMMMLSPIMISLPFKLMLFVLVDGWSLILGTLAGSFYLTT
ncbi:MAG: flagellar type III secretion system pore protein FliP [Thiotrichales bacterium]